MTIKMLQGAVSLAEIEARRAGVHIMSEEERAAVRKGLAQADRGEFVPDELVAEADKRHDR
jgi:predicted transcriptional regulator